MDQREGALFESMSMKRLEERLACLFMHSAVCATVAFTGIRGGIMGKLMTILLFGFDFSKSKL